MVMGCYFLVSFFDYDLDAASDKIPSTNPVPNWVWLVCFICTFVAHILGSLYFSSYLFVLKALFVSGPIRKSYLLYQFR